MSAAAVAAAVPVFLIGVCPRDIMPCHMGTLPGLIKLHTPHHVAPMMGVEERPLEVRAVERRAAHLMRMDLTVATARSTSCVVMA